MEINRLHAILEALYKNGNSDLALELLKENIPNENKSLIKEQEELDDFLNNLSEEDLANELEKEFEFEEEFNIKNLYQEKSLNNFTNEELEDEASKLIKDNFDEIYGDKPIIIEDDENYFDQYDDFEDYENEVDEEDFYMMEEDE